MNAWAAIVGRGDAKRDALRQVVAGLRQRGVRVGGLMQIPMPESEGGGCDLLDLASDRRLRLATISCSPDICDYAFDAEGFARSRAWIAETEAEVFALEIGKLEARGEAHWPAARSILDGSRPALALLCVRPDVLFAVADPLPDPVAGIELPAGDGELKRFVEALVAAVNKAPL